ncbi:MAG: response regulator transcription factor [Alphaproteobacteria bacterium]|nr:response regulator transcription factor [Alphaproteobacteria bacterium]MDE2112091.1 response regulator transcription factor [Alphaproteobacteria bacterium]MDE2493889.1 response regulator transcription factor [Alphaproteobacteria bacterium]
MKILLIEDDDDTSQYVAKGLRQSGHMVERVRAGNKGLAIAKDNAHDVIILDRMLPEMDGLSLAKQLRESGSQTPILFLTTMGGIGDRVAGLEAGGDDYLVKPFALAELIARVNSLTRRSQRTSADTRTTLRVNDLEIDLIARTVSRSGRRIDLQPQEFRLLEYLVRHEGRVVTRTMLIENVWELHFDPQTNIVESHMSRLRTKVDKDFPVQLIQTIRGTGYVLRGN